jgi:hypothetical protein
MSGDRRALVERLLEDESLSYREIGRRAGCSDWTVRSIARKLSGDSRPLKSPRREHSSGDDDAPTGAVGWTILAGIVAFFGAIAWLARRSPGNGGSMP